MHCHWQLSLPSCQGRCWGRITLAAAWTTLLPGLDTHAPAGAGLRTTCSTQAAAAAAVQCTASVLSSLKTQAHISLLFAAACAWLLLLQHLIWPLAACIDLSTQVANGSEGAGARSAAAWHALLPSGSIALPLGGDAAACMQQPQVCCCSYGLMCCAGQPLLGMLTR